MSEGLTRADYQEALDVQNAPNLSGIVRSFCDVMNRIWFDNHSHGTDAVNNHPIARMFAEQILFLTGGGMGNSETYRDAMKKCRERSKE